MSQAEIKQTKSKPIKLVVPAEMPKKDNPNDYSEKEKMLLGLPYMTNDEELKNARAFVKMTCYKFNNTEPLDFDGRSEILKELLGTANNAYIKPPFYCDYGSNIHLGQNTYMNHNCLILDVCEVRIGDNTLFAPGVQVLTATHPLDPIERRTTEYGKSIKIGKDCWIGGNAIILPGVTIGDGVTIGAGAVVTKDIESYSVAVGNPARVIKKLPVPKEEN